MISCLIVDDDKFERDGLRYMIEQRRFPLHVTDVRNGKLALERMNCEHFDMVITDIKMPVMDGITFLEQAKHIQPDAVYIIYSGYSDFQYAKKAISLQVMEFMVKPVSDAEFDKVMHDAISHIEEQQAKTKSSPSPQTIQECLFRGTPCAVSESECIAQEAFFCHKQKIWDEEASDYLREKRFLTIENLKHLTDSLPDNLSFLAEKMTRVKSVEELEELIAACRESEQDALIYDVKQYIKNHFANDLTVEDIAGKVYLSPTYLCTIFKKQTGTTLIRYLTNCRMEQAVILLKNPVLKTSDVARRVGYQNISYFNLLFKEHTGKTPRQYRKALNDEQSE